MALSSGSTSQVTKKGEHAEQRQVKSYAKGRKAKKNCILTSMMTNNSVTHHFQKATQSAKRRIKWYDTCENDDHEHHMIKVWRSSTSVQSSSMSIRSIQFMRQYGPCQTYREKNEKGNRNCLQRCLSFIGNKQKRPDVSVKDRGDQLRDMGEKGDTKQKLDNNHV